MENTITMQHITITEAAVPHAEVLLSRLKRAASVNDHAFAKQAVLDFMKTMEDEIALLGDIDLLDAGVAACQRHDKVVKYDYCHRLDAERIGIEA
jgi:hypothetical protein